MRFMTAVHGLIYCDFSDGRARAYDSRLRLTAWAEVCGQCFVADAAAHAKVDGHKACVSDTVHALQTPKGAAVACIAISAVGQLAIGAPASDVPDVIVSLESGSCLKLPRIGFGTSPESSRCRTRPLGACAEAVPRVLASINHLKNARATHRSGVGAPQIQVLLQHPRSVVAMAAHPRLPLVAVCSGRIIVLWDTDRHERLRGLEVSETTNITTLCFGHKHDWLAFGTASGNITMLAVDTLDHCYDLKQVKKVLTFAVMRITARPFMANLAVTRLESAPVCRPWL